MGVSASADGMVAAALKIAGVAAISVWLGVSAVPARADDDRAALEAQKAALFQQMLHDPANLTTTLAYADAAARLGDNEAAVSALERLLLFNPNLPRVDLELGVLYYRMGSFDAARSYLQKVATLNPPTDVQASADRYLGMIGALDSPQHLTGYFLFGPTYQSDATVSSSNALVQSPISNQLLGNTFTKQTGINLSGAGGVLYSYDLGTQDRDAFEVGGVGFADHYFRNSNIDLDFGEVTAGPRLRYPNLGIPFVEWASLKPYAIVNEVGLGEQQYFYTLGAGLEATAVLWGDVSARVAYEFRNKNFTAAPDRPASSGLTGNDNLVNFTLKKPITANSVLVGEFDYLNQSTRFNYFSNNTYAVAASYQVHYNDPTGMIKLPLQTEIFGSRTWSIYGAPDPCCATSPSPNVFSGSDRLDRHWRFGATQNFPITPTLSVVLQVERDVVSSNLPVYGYTSNTVLLGPQFRF
jgi:hypothetical protein